MQSIVHRHFPRAIRADKLVARVNHVLTDPIFKTERLYCFSLCADEINRATEQAFAGHNYFSMGGLAGVPFGGRTALAAMSSHIAGHAVWVYGPHVGIDRDGTVGKVERSGLPGSGGCCGSALAASAAAAKDDMALDDFDADTLDVQQAAVTALVNGHKHTLNACQSEQERMVKLPMVLYEEIDQMAVELVEKGQTHDMALLGGIQINTADIDYFLPLRFDTRPLSGGGDNLLGSLLEYEQ